MVIGQQTSSSIPHVCVMPRVACYAQHALQASCAHTPPVPGYPCPKGCSPCKQLLFIVVSRILRGL